MPQSVWADTVTATGGWSAGQAKSITPIIVIGQNWNITSYAAGNSWNYTLYPFFVGTNGTYSATVTTSPVVNTTFLLRGLFSPSSVPNPATPIGNFITSSFSGGNTASLTNLPLTAGQQYTFLVAYNIGGSAATDISTLTITGIGCINFGTTYQCSRYITGPNVAMGNYSALNAARVIDANSNLLSLFAPLSAGNQQEIAKATTQILPLLTGGSTSATRSTMASVNSIVQARLDHASGRASGDGFLGDNNVWMKPFASHAAQGDHDAVSGYTAKTNGLVAGVDGALSPALRVGGAITYAVSDITGKSTDAPQSNNVSIYQLIGYGSYALDANTDVNFQADVGKNTNRGHRQIAFTSSVATSSYDSQTAHVGVGIGRNYPLTDSTTLTPSLRADYTWIKDKAYQETGAGQLNLLVRARSTDALVLSIGGKLAHQLNDQTTLVANLGAGYDALNRQDAITASFAGASDAAFVTYGIKPSPWIGRGGLGVVYKLKTGLEITGRYDVEYRESFLNQTASANLRWTF